MTSALARSTSRENKLIVGIFLLAFGFSLWGVSVGWTNPNLYGNEFRQTQTAISALFIQRENNFSLAYPTPILGKPWSVPYEFPLYQWAVVTTSNHTGLSLASAARLVCAVCFYAGLPAFFFLLRRQGFTKTHCLIVLSLVLTCPLYIFYSRAFLIETMALMFGFWYLAALIKAIEQRSYRWLVLVNLAGIGAGTVKVTTFMVFLLPAFCCSLWWLWQSRPRKGYTSWIALLRTTGWLVAAHVLPFASTLWWLHFSDGIKLLNPSGVALTSTNLTAFNFGIGHRFEPATWAAHWKIISQEITTPLTLAVGVVIAVIFARRWWLWIVGYAGLYLFTQAIFPVLYAAHDYYHVASAFLLAGALGFAAVGAFENNRLSRIVPFTLWILLLALQAHTYLKVDYPLQRTLGNTGGLVDALKQITEPDDVLLIAGNDWSAIVPYYAGRRALMLRQDILRDEASIRKSFELLKGESVTALVLVESERENALVIRLAAEYFGIEPEHFLPCHNHGKDSVIYLHRQIWMDAQSVLKKMRIYFEGVGLPKPPTPIANPLAGTIFEYNHLLPRNLHFFHGMTPRPVRFYSTFGPELWDENKPGQERYSAHPETKLWFKLTPGHHQLTTIFELIPAAYQGVPYPEVSDGVELVATAVRSDGRRDILHQLYLNPRDNPANRGPQPIDWSFDLPSDSELELSVNAGPKGNAARDWAALSSIKIE